MTLDLILPLYLQHLSMGKVEMYT